MSIDFSNSSSKKETTKHQNKNKNLPMSYTNITIFCFYKK